MNMANVAGILSVLEKEGEWKITITRMHPQLATVKETRSQRKLDIQYGTIRAPEIHSSRYKLEHLQ